MRSIAIRSRSKKLNPHLHNVPMQIAAERGLPALAIWLWFVGTVVLDLWQKLRTSRHRFLAADRVGGDRRHALGRPLRAQLRRLGIPDALPRPPDPAVCCGPGRRGVKPSSLPALDPNRAGAVAAEFSAASVLVIGDVMLDQFLIGRVSRISPEAPVPIVHYGRSENRIGGAANVAHNVMALGGKASLSACRPRYIRVNAARRAERKRTPTDGLVEDAHRPTTTKVRVVTDRHQQVARVDYERRPRGGWGRSRLRLVESGRHASPRTTGANCRHRLSERV